MAQGSIKPRTLKSGKVVWDVIVDFPTDSHGGRKQRRRTFPTKREAEKGRTVLLTEIEQGTVVDRSHQTVAQVMDEYLRLSAQHNVRPTTLEGYERTIRVHIIPPLGHIQIQKLTPADLETFYHDKLTAGASRRILQLCRFHLVKALNRAVKLELVSRNVAEAVSLPRGKPAEEMQTWDKDQTRRFLSVAGHSSYGPIWLVLLASGMRRGEALGLRWQDVGWEHQTLSIRQSVVLLHNKPVVQQPKTRSSRREVPVSREVMAALRAHERQQGERKQAGGASWHDHDLVFATECGTLINPNNLARDFRRWVAHAGVPLIRIHDLRHTFVTLALANKADSVAVSRHVGHARTSITMDLYAHALHEQRAEVADKMAAMLFDPTPVDPV